MTTNKNDTTEATLRHIFRHMDAHAAQEIREAYYKAVEGLQSLADALEVADATLQGPANGLLMVEHAIACEAIETMSHSRLGRIL